MKTAKQLTDAIEIAQHLANLDRMPRVVYVLPLSGSIVFPVEGDNARWVETSGAVALCRVEPAEKAVRA